MWQFVKSFADTACTSNGFCTNLPESPASANNLHNIIQIFLAIFAAVAVLIIVIAAFNLVLAGGDPSKVAKARSAIIYALVGLVLAVSAEVVVLFVLGLL